MSADLETRVRTVELDFASHEARSAVFWETQQQTNTVTLETHVALHDRISKEAARTDTSEKKFAWVLGMGAGVTGLLAIAATVMRIL